MVQVPENKMLKPVNYVAGGEIGEEIDLYQLCDYLEDTNNAETIHSSDTPWQLILKFEKSGMAIIYRTGKYIIRGGSKLNKLERTKRSFFNIMLEIGLISSTQEISFRVQNIVYLVDLDESLDLSEIVLELGLNQTEYEPEQFPGVIFNPKRYELVMLLFATGKVIITGTTTREEAENAVSEVIDTLY